MSVTLDPHFRGDTFEYSFTLQSPWTPAMFTGGLRFTLRTAVTASTVVSDDDAVDKASVANGEITFVGQVGTVLIPASRTTTWPHGGKLLWDLQGIVTGAPNKVYTIEDGTVLIRGDVTRLQ